jgi:hypothetical protein
MAFVAVGSACTLPLVEVAIAGLVGPTVGGLPLAGSRQPVMIRASAMNNAQVRMIFLFIEASWGPVGYPYGDILHHFENSFVILELYLGCNYEAKAEGRPRHHRF